MIQVFPKGETKPCPFCGGKEIRFHEHPPEGRGLHAKDPIFSMGCYNCGATFPNRYKLELLVGLWNKRTETR